MELEDVPELIHNIQSRLPVEDAARTSVLSKSWLHAWSTSPTLGVRKDMNVDRTLKRYLRDNIPIEKFDLDINAENQESASLAEEWTRLVATTQISCLKELSVSIRVRGASFTVPDEILSGENLTKIRVSGCYNIRHTLWMARHPVINCVSLRELQLKDVHVSEEVLHHILSSCSFLVKISLLRVNGLKTLMIKNRPYLEELTLASVGYPTIFQVNNVPNLSLFTCKQHYVTLPFDAHSISLGSSVTQLSMGGLIIDDAFLNMIKSKFPLLESLTINMSSSNLTIFDFKCASMKRLNLTACPHTLLHIHVYAPNLTLFRFNGDTLPNLLFPATTISTFKEIEFFLTLCNPVDVSFFLKMREALALSRKCYLSISTPTIMPIDIDDLRARLRFPPAMNVDKMEFESVQDECLWEHSTFFDAFFEICHPNKVFAYEDSRFKDKNHFSRLMLKEVLETTTSYWPQYLKHVQIKLHQQQWETLTNSHKSFLDGSARLPVTFSLQWC